MALSPSNKRHRQLVYPTRKLRQLAITVSCLHHTVVFLPPLLLLLGLMILKGASGGVLWKRRTSGVRVYRRMGRTGDKVFMGVYKWLVLRRDVQRMGNEGTEIEWWVMRSCFWSHSNEKRFWDGISEREDKELGFGQKTGNGISEKEMEGKGMES